MNVKKAVFAWSGGKDSAYAMYEIKKSGGYDVMALLTTVTRDYDRISMHGVRTELLEAQAEALKVPLKKVFIGIKASNIEYEKNMEKALLEYRDKGVECVIFGDIFLEDLRQYRENNLAKLGMKAVFPLWKKDTAKLAESFIYEGFKAVLACVDGKILDKSFAGREYDRSLLKDLHPTIDPCGENGEFHSFVYAGPVFDREIAVKKEEVVLREERFWYCDLMNTI
jgi:uncharacterized protein (TIGR00290 family)